MNRPKPFAPASWFLAVVCVAATWLLAVTPLTADEWKVGLAQAVITPVEPLWLAGYDNRNHPSVGVLDDLVAQAAAFEDAAGNRAVLLTVDLCVLRKANVNDVCARIAAQTGLPRERILVNLSHTHSGPAVDLDDGSMYAIPEAEQTKLAHYTQTLKQTLATLAVDALTDLQPAQLTYSVGRAEFFENRRILGGSGTWAGMGPNPSNHTDRDVPVLQVASPDGNVRAVLFGAACHNVTLGGNNYKISGDYAAYARRTILEAFPDAQTMFVTGCGADANPEPRATADEEEWVVRHGQSLGTEVVRVLGGSMETVAGGIDTRFQMVDLPLKTGMTRAEIEQIAASGAGWDRHVAGMMLAALDRGETLPTTYSAPIAAWSLGDLMLVGLPEETVSEYVPLLKDILGADGLWTAGYCNDVSGYLPTVNIINQGGYENRGLFGPDIGWFAPEVESVVVGKVREMAIDLGRKLPIPGGPYTAPIGWWQMEPGAFLSDASGHGKDLVSNHGVAVETERTFHEASLASGAFSGNGYLEGGNDPEYNGDWDGLTLAAWIRPSETGLGGVRVICGKWANTVENDHYLLFLMDGKPGIAVADGETAEGGFISGTALTPNEWHFVAATWDKGTGRYRLFVDGAEPQTGYQNGEGLNTQSNKTFKIGAEAVSGFERYFHGLIDDVWLFDAALGEGAIEQLRQGKYYWTFLDGDLDGDGLVGSADLDIIRANWGRRVPAGDRAHGDPSGDGRVDSLDLDRIRANWGARVSAVPEPSASVVTPCGLFGMMMLFGRGRPAVKPSERGLHHVLEGLAP